MSAFWIQRSTELAPRKVAEVASFVATESSCTRDYQVPSPPASETNRFIVEHSPFLDDVVKTVHRLVLLETLCSCKFSPSKSAAELLRKSLVLPQRLEHWFMLQESDVLGVVEARRCRVSLVRALGVSRLTREDALEDAKTTEIGETELEFLESLIPGNVVLCGS